MQYSSRALWLFMHDDRSENEWRFWRAIPSMKTNEIQCKITAWKLFYVCIQDQSFNNFENDIMNLSLDEAKLSGLWARNFATIQLVLISKFAFGPEKSRNRPRNSYRDFRETGPWLDLVTSIEKNSRI